jgi:protein-tyrosine-phosphatase
LTLSDQKVGSFDPQAKNEADMIVEDPYYGGQSGFTKNFEQIHRACNQFLDQLNK